MRRGFFGDEDFGALVLFVRREDLLFGVAPLGIDFPWVEFVAGDGLALRQLVEKDRPILDAAIAGACTHLLTGDKKHFGAWMGKSVAGVKIVSHRMMTEELRGRGIVE